MPRAFAARRALVSGRVSIRMTNMNDVIDGETDQDRDANTFEETESPPERNNRTDRAT